jgi:hypothetical protein
LTDDFWRRRKREKIKETQRKQMEEKSKLRRRKERIRRDSGKRKE